MPITQSRRPPAPSRPTPAAPILRPALAAAAGAALLAGGCDSYKAPALSVASAEATERTPDGAAMLFTLDARNDNDVPLPLRTVEYRVSLDGREVFAGTRSAEATLRRLGVQQVRLPAVVPLTPANQGLAAGPARYTLSGRMYYQTPGQFAEVLFDVGVRTPNVTFSFDGPIDLSTGTFVPAAPPASPAPAPAPAPGVAEGAGGSPAPGVDPAPR